MSPQQISKLIHGPLREMMLAQRKAVNDAAVSEDTETMRVIGSLGLSVFCMSVAYIDPNSYMKMLEFQTNASREMLHLPLPEQKAINQAIQKVIISQQPSPGNSQ